MFVDLQLLHYPYVDHALMLYTCSSVNPIDCRVPTIVSGVIGEYNTTTVSSVIIYQCQQQEFTPSVRSSVCGEDERWSPDPSQVMCRIMVPLPTGTPTEATPNGTTLPTGMIKYIDIQWLMFLFQNHLESE